jgi:RNA polymerase sigma-70 factor, ECF subfamily
MGGGSMVVESIGTTVAGDEDESPEAVENHDPALEHVFADMWRRYYRRLWAFARTYAAMSAEEAEDAVQEIMWKLYRSLPRLDRRRPSTPWVFRVARNHCIDLMRARGLRASTVDGPPLPDDVVEPSPGPPEALELSEAEAGVRRFMRAVDPADRQILYLAYYERLRMRNIAEALDMPEGTVKYRIHELKGRLRRSLEAEE